uniref:Disease resistance protein RPM1 n=1 Tax=Aegilops tauschii subsp. strangulata TaxID=200361 RepID=A0A453GFQ1_AEGTS
MAEAVLLALGKIGKVLTDEVAKALVAKVLAKVGNLIDLNDKIGQIEVQLKAMNNIIREIGTMYLTNEFMKGWIGEVRKLAYRVEDVLDKYSYHSLQMAEEGFLKKRFLKGSHYLLVFSQITEEVVKIEKDIKQVIELKGWSQPPQYVHDPLSEVERQRSQDRFPELVKDEDLIGIEDNRRMLTEWLYSDEMDGRVITVSGMGGLGKTTLTTNVYEREKANFQAHAWVVVSQTYTVEALLRKLLRKVGYTEQQASSNIDRMDVYDLKEEIKRTLQDRKCLFVLDDVWNQDVYYQLRDALQNSRESRIIITTRNNHVAAVAHSSRRIDLKPLGDNDAFELFCRRVFYSKKDQQCPDYLLETAKSIVHRCRGLPLAILSIGGLFLFSEDYPMSRETLVRLWVAEGFVLRKGNSTPEEVAEENLRKLIHRNMLEVMDRDELGRVSTCTMHDIVRELALCIAREERFVSTSDYGTMQQMDMDARRLSSCGWKENTARKIELPRLRTLVSLGATPAMLSSVLSKSSYLTVLELQDSEITEVPALIGTLFNLRYIGLRRTKVRSLPSSVEKLSNLQTLDIKQTKIEKLPSGIVKLKNLRHLFADRFADEKQTEFRYFIGVQAPKELSSIEELQTLETIQASKDLAEQLKTMMQLRTLWIDNISSADCANIFDTLSNMKHLSSLLLSGKDENEALCFEALKPRSAHLHKLIIRGKWAKGTLDCPIFCSHGENLKYLALSWCHLGEDEDPLGMLAPHLRNLTYLKLNNMRSANALVLSAGSFPQLKTLVLKDMPHVNELKIMDGALPCIDGLYVVSLSKLDKVPRGIESLGSLKKLWLLRLHRDFKTQWDINGMHQKMARVPEVRV